MLRGMTGAALSFCLVRRDELGCNCMLRQIWLCASRHMLGWQKMAQQSMETAQDGPRWPSSPCVPTILPAAAHSSCVQLDQVDFAGSLGSSTHLMMRGGGGLLAMLATHEPTPVRHAGCVRAVKQPLHGHKQGLGRD